MIAFLDAVGRPDAVTSPGRVPSQSPDNNDEGIITMTITGESARRLEITRLARETTTTEGNR
jgi:hypothetical protein